MAFHTIQKSSLLKTWGLVWAMDFIVIPPYFGKGKVFSDNSDKLD